MHVELCIDQRALRRWHLDLARSLRELPGVAVGIRWAPPEGEPTPACGRVLFAPERTVHALPDGPASPLEPDDLARHVGEGGARPDVAVDLAGTSPASAERRLLVTFDGVPGEAAALAALLHGRMPAVGVSDAASGTLLASGWPGLDAPDVVVSSFEQVLATTTTLIRAAIAGGGRPRRLATSPADLSCGLVAGFGAKALTRTALRRISGLLGRSGRGVPMRESPAARQGSRRGTDKVDARAG